MIDISALPNIQAATANLINGEMKDDNVPGDNSGVPVRKDWVQDLYYSFIAVMNAAGIVADNSVEGATASQFLEAIYAVTGNSVRTQDQFDAKIERVAANQYKFIDTLTNVKVLPLTGGYLMSSVLSDGDTWGYLETNNCTSIEFINGAYIDMENERGYIEVNTDHCYLKNIIVMGTGTVASAVVQSFLLGANYVTYDNCKTHTRLSNTNLSGFKGSGTALHNRTSKYTNCSVYDLTSSGFCYGFNGCFNLTNPLVHTLESTGSFVNALASCQNIVNATLLELDATNILNGASSCLNMCNIYIEDVDSSGAEARGIASSELISNAYIKDIQSAVNQVVYGLKTCNNVSSIHIEALDTSGAGIVYGMQSCNQVSAVEIEDLDGAGTVFGCHTCNQLSSVKVEDLNSTGGLVSGMSTVGQSAAISIFNLLAPVNNAVYGISSCNNMSGVKIEQLDTSGTGDVYGISTCNQLSAVEVTDLDGVDIVYGVHTCNQISAIKVDDLESSGDDVFGLISCDQVAGVKVEQLDSSGTGIAIGFSSSREIAGCQALSIAAAGSGDAEGFDNCDRVSACYAQAITSDSGEASGFKGVDACSAIVANTVTSTSSNAFGIQTCLYLSAVATVTINAGGVANGFNDCDYGSSLWTNETVNPNNNFIDTADGGGVIAVDFSCNDNWT